MPEEEIHLWYIDLDQSAAHEAWLASSLCRAERVAADQFFFTLDRRRLVTRRGVLRLILSEYLEIGPADLSFRVNANGKPELTGRSAADRSTVDLTLASGWVGALVMSDPKRRLVSRQWLPE